MIKPAGECGTGKGESRRAVRAAIASRYPPGGSARGETDGRVRVARRWRLVGRQFGRIAAVSQLFSVLLFPQLFSTLHCAFRSALADALPVYQPPDRPLLPLRPCPRDPKASLRYTANFSLLSLFRRRTKRQRRLSRSPEKPSLSFLCERTERSSYGKK